MKKLLLAVLLVLFVGGLVGCGEKSSPPAPQDNATKAPEATEAPK